MTVLVHPGAVIAAPTISEYVDFRASRLPLLTKCAGAAFIPNVIETRDERERATDWGHMVHHWKETGNIVGPGEPSRYRSRMENDFRTAISASGVERLSLWPSEGVHEQPVAVRVDGCREVSRTHPTGLDEPSRWITGTDDFHWWVLAAPEGDPRGILWVDDLKTGKWYDDGEGGNRYPQDVRSTQLRLYALAISVLLGYTGNVLVSLTHWPRLPVERRHAPPERYWTEYTHEELQAFWSELEELYRTIEVGRMGTLVLNPGDHCRFCPARPNCFVAQEFDNPWTTT